MLKIDSVAERRLKNIGNTAICAIFICCLFMLSVFFFVVDKRDVSDIEGRELSKFPMLWDGKTVNSDFYAELDNYYLDAFPFRDQFLLANRQIQTLYTLLTLPGKDDDVVFIAAGGTAIGNNPGNIGDLDFEADIFWEEGFSPDSSRSGDNNTMVAEDSALNGSAGAANTTLKYASGGGESSAGSGEGSEAAGSGAGGGDGEAVDGGAGDTTDANATTTINNTTTTTNTTNTTTTAATAATTAAANATTAATTTAATAATAAAATTAAAGGVDTATATAAAAGGAQASPQPQNTQARNARGDDYEANESTGVSIVAGQAFEIFVFSESRTIAYAETVDEIAEKCGVPAYVVTPPSASELFLPEKYRTLENEQKPAFNLLAATLKNAVYVDTYNVFEEEKDNYVYFRTDHHWTADGAYLAYREFVKAAGLTPVYKHSMKQGRLDGFLGSLYRQIYANRHSVLLEQEPDYVNYYEPIYDVEVINFRDENMTEGVKGAVLMPDGDLGTNTYNVFFGGDMHLLYMHSGVGNGRSIMVVRDSYGHAFLPFLTNNYEYVFALEPRYFESFPLAKFIADHEIEELLFVNHSLLATARYWMNWITELEKLH